MRGAKRGTAQEGSLAAKMLNIRIGETIFLEDRQESGKATIMERQVTNIIAKSAALEGRTFTTERWIAARQNPVEAKAILAIRRVA